MSKLTLGSAQFGLDYGINNGRGKIPSNEVFMILDEAYMSGVDTLDTAPAYGESEKVIGEYQSKYGREFKVVSKLPRCAAEDIENVIDVSLERLNLSSLYGYLIHDYETYKADPKILEILKDNKFRRRIKKVGFSLYYPNELDELLGANVCFDIIQLPYSVFDQRFYSYFIELKKRGVEIHVRSIFLQGLVFKKINELGSEFFEIKEKLTKLDNLSVVLGLSRLSLCFNYIAANKYIDKIVVGVDSLDNFKEIISVANNGANLNDHMEELKNISINDENIIIPANWSRKI